LNAEEVLSESKRLIRSYLKKWQNEKERNTGCVAYETCALLESEFNGLMADFLLHMKRMDAGESPDGDSNR